MRFAPLAVLCGLLASSVMVPLSTSAGSADMGAGAVANEPAVRGGRTSVPTPEDLLLDELFDLLNAQRAAVGLGPLLRSSVLDRIAQDHSDDMVAIGTIGYLGTRGETIDDRLRLYGYGFRAWAVNVASAYPSPDDLVRGWMASPGHRANILRDALTEVGVGLRTSATGRPYWTAVFAAPGA